MMKPVARAVVAFLCGLIFGVGLSLSGMLDPARVQGFLDVTGAWDKSLAFVMGGAVMVTFCGLVLVRRMRAPVLDATFDLTLDRRIDARLIGGSVLFGMGWGMAGLCPGPAMAALSTGLAPVLVFVAAMVVGMAIHDRLLSPRQTGYARCTAQERVAVRAVNREKVITAGKGRETP